MPTDRNSLISFFSAKSLDSTARTVPLRRLSNEKSTENLLRVPPGTRAIITGTGHASCRSAGSAHESHRCCSPPRASKSCGSGKTP